MQPKLTPQGRQQLLASIAPEDAAEHHATLQALFEDEITYRQAADGVLEYFENLYWCAYLLYCVGDPSDVPMMWRAKNINFDTGTGFDVQALFGAGVEQTLAYLRGHGHEGIAHELSEYIPFDTDDLDGWARWRRQYYYA